MKNYIKGAENKPLAYQLEVVKKQLNYFQNLNKENLTNAEKEVLVEAWETANKLRFVIANRIRAILNFTSLN
jgi:hypothetical protein